MIDPWCSLLLRCHTLLGRGGKSLLKGAQPLQRRNENFKKNERDRKAIPAKLHELRYCHCLQTCPSICSNKVFVRLERFGLANKRWFKTTKVRRATWKVRSSTTANWTTAAANWTTTASWRTNSHWSSNGQRREHWQRSGTGARWGGTKGLLITVLPCGIICLYPPRQFYQILICSTGQ